jgi:hypothetical protein
LIVDAFSLTASVPGTGAGVAPEPAALLLAAAAIGIFGAMGRFDLRRNDWRRKLRR